MARPLRIEYPGGNLSCAQPRGDRRETILYDDAGKQREIISRRAFTSRRQLRFHMTYSFLRKFLGQGILRWNRVDVAPSFLANLPLWRQK
jgi:hypothetical protein